MADKQPFNPKSTTVTNLALDEIMPRVSPNAWKIICVALRKTQGWADPDSPTGRKESDVIAISQFMAGTGIGSKHTAMDAISECLAAGYLLRVPSGQSFCYSLNLSFVMPDTGAETAPVQKENWRGNCTGTGAETAPVLLETGAETAHTNTNTNSKINTKREGGAKNAPRAPVPDHDPVTPSQRKQHQLPIGPEPTDALRAYLVAANAAQQPQSPCSEVRVAIDTNVTDVSRWRDHLRTWTMKGYRFANVADLLDTFKHGFKTPGGNTRGNSTGIIKSTSSYTADA